MLLGYDPLETIMAYASEVPLRREVEAMRSSTPSLTYADFSGPVEVTVIQLLPDFDGNFDDDSGDEGDSAARSDIITYTSEELDGLQNQVQTDNDGFLDDFFQDPMQLPALGISPAMVQRIRSDSLGKNDYLKLKAEREKREESSEDNSSQDSSDETTTEGCVPVLLGRSSPRLSLSQDGFIILNDYKISPDTLGGGKLSEVRIAYGAHNDTQYAVKIHSKMKLMNYSNLLRSRNPMEEVHREIDILKKLDHPNIIKLVDVVDNDDDDNLYLVFERLNHELMTIPTDKPFSEAVARKYFKDILAGVDYLHQNGIVHRDLKPENMLVSRNGTVKIADFGFCEHMTDNPVNPRADKLVACVSGTPSFTPPECLASFSGPVSACALDMWTLGITLFALVVGDVPFKADNIFQLHRAIKESAVAYPPGRVVSSALRDLISRLLEKDPEVRIRSAEVRKHPWVVLMEGSSPTSVRSQNAPRFLMSVGSRSELSSTTSDDF
ncbi:Calcium/calmodulin-dependent protein kinase kinase 2 [Hypsibius exemplaris]|uniref:Calcium/calmodulin-dependent protein kinase kinase 2 n=1 Tax=Hypsibius exemplaris TaxID=2072580 RepID=A0A1W0X4J2_HYPEX|nr:Calcium/calmodulin-dependent protein kinase kinase 2 [Hypsibius exemplaris]